MDTKTKNSELAAAWAVIENSHEYSQAQLLAAAETIKQARQSDLQMRVKAIIDIYEKSNSTIPNLPELVNLAVSAWDEIEQVAVSFGYIGQVFNEFCQKNNVPADLAATVMAEMEKNIPLDEDGRYNLDTSDRPAYEDFGIDLGELCVFTPDEGWHLPPIDQLPPQIQVAHKKYEDAVHHYFQRQDAELKSRLSNLAKGNYSPVKANLPIHRQQGARRATCRQGHAARKPAAKSSDSDSGDGDGGGDGEPPHRRLFTQKQSADPQAEQPLPPLQLYNAEAFSQLVGCARKTIYNLVSQGKISRPVKTLAGPRFSVQHYVEFIGQAPRPNPTPKPDKPRQVAEKRPRGRPRIAAQQMGNGGRQ